jgi:Transcription factor WhiB
MTVGEQDFEWRRRAVCFTEMSDAPELWTPNTRPADKVRVHLERMCQRCPVRRQCAEDAVSTEAESGMYAGVWVPEHKENNGWYAAMDELRLIAGLAPVEVELTALKASA